MKIEGEAELLRIYVGESDRVAGGSLHEVIIRRAREHGLAGATAWRGLLGYGANSRIHTASVLRLSTDLPVIIEIIDRPERIRGFLPILDQLVGEGLITIQPVHVMAYRHAPVKSPQA